MNFGSPLALISRVSLPAAGTPVLFSSDALQAPNREAIAVSEIRFHSDYAAFSADDMQPAREIRVSISIGSRFRVCENMPLWALCPSRGFSLENMGGLICNYRLKLRRPLFIQPGVAVIASARRVADPAGQVYSASAIPLYMTLVARTVISDFPRTVNVPYLSSFCPNGSLAGIFNSLEEDLKNDSDQPVEIEHLVGRLGGGSVGAGDLVVWDRFDPAIVAPMRLSYQGREIVPDGTDFNAAFDPVTRSLPMARMVLDKGKRLMFSMPAPVNSGLFTMPQVWLPTVGLIASRQEALS